jgi:acetyltransferase
MAVSADPVPAAGAEGSVPPGAGGRFIAGDPLRGIGLLAVITYHAAYFGRVPLPFSADMRPNYGEVLGLGLASLDIGLFIFFVLSGYLIAGPFIQRFVEGRDPPAIGNYLRNRALRIVPGFWAITAVVLIVNRGTDSSPIEIASVFLFLQAFFHLSDLSTLMGPAWSLAVELVFYLLVPVCAVVLTSIVGTRGDERSRRRIVLGLTATLFVASLLLSRLSIELPHRDRVGVSPDYAWDHSLPPLLFAFMPGIALAAVEPVLRPRVRKLARPDLLALGLLGAAIVTLVVYAATGAHWAIGPRPGIDTRFYVAAAAGLVMFAALVLQWGCDRAWRALDNRVFRWAGERSYSTYLIHQAIVLQFVSWSFLATHPRLHSLTILAATLAISFPLAALSYRLVELRFLRMKGRWRRPAGSRAGPR